MSTVPFPVPERGPEEIVRATITLGLGGQARRLPVLPIEANEAWTDAFRDALSAQIQAMPSVETLADVASTIGSATNVLIDLLVQYDRDGVLGGREWIRANATPPEVYEAFKQVTAAAFPFGGDLARFAPQLRTMLLQALVQEASSPPTKPSPKRTGGRRRASGAS